jgi:hypothetical protein
MQSRELPRHEIDNDSQATPKPPHETADSSAAAMLKTLPISVIFKMLAKRHARPPPAVAH